MNIVFALSVLATYSLAFALTRKPWLPWAICSVVFGASAAALVVFTNATSVPAENTRPTPLRSSS
ncbi:hypothetical protein [Novosphingobium sp. JCM 18896]|uniref:hypothetical protein n=1 Tax=Novosphingobium sp. JCM 18896 TaxID=2989731 RepID=UPI002221EDBD|nr:hypothetical protein [Novosphingobium sp. JCM 18896]MCW1432466.1 hypothetical protein [Novosphingobium sp. JCM 18896]